MSIPGRYFSERDINFVNSINDELLDDVIQTEIVFFKMNADVTTTNIYGESKASTGKTYYPGIEFTCRIDRGDIVTDADDFGPDRKQKSAFMFKEKDLQAKDFFPENGDLVLFNERYYEVNNVVQEQFLGGIPDKSFSIIVNTHYTRLSAVDVVVRQS